jgi:hypothetical protein
VGARQGAGGGRPGGGGECDGMPVPLQNLDGGAQQRVAASPEFARTWIVNDDGVLEFCYGVFSSILVKL